MANQRRLPAAELKDQRPSHLPPTPERVAGVEADMLPRVGEIPIPPYPAGLSETSKKRWDLYWTSPLRDYVISIDRVTLVERYFRIMDLNASAYRRVSREMLTTGSTGQKRINPAWQLYRETAGLMAHLEEQLGIGPRSRLRLNITFGEAAETFDRWFDALTKKYGDTGAQDDGPGVIVDIDPETGEVLGLL